MNVIISTYLIILRSLFEWLVGRTSPYSVAIESLLAGKSYRYNSKLPRDRLLLIKYWFKSLKIINRKSGQQLPANIATNPSTALFIPSTKVKELIQSYVELCSGSHIDLVISREDYCSFSFLERITLTVTSTVWAFLLFPITLFSPNYVSLALSVIEMIENICLLKMLRQNNVDVFFHIGAAFNKDVNFTALLSRRFGIELHKVASPNPLKSYYENNVCDVFYYTAPYQDLEAKKFKNWFVHKTETWPVIYYQRLIPYIKDSNREPPKNTLAFISSGGWLRVEQGGIAGDEYLKDEEESILESLSKILKEHPEITLLIFLHPVEKKNDSVYDYSKSYYKNILKGMRISFPDRKLKSYKLLKQVDVSIAHFSTLNMERLFCGYKTLFTSLKSPATYLSGDTLDRICAKNPTELKTLVLKALSMSTNAFFSSFQIERYHHSHFSAFVNKKQFVKPENGNSIVC